VASTFFSPSFGAILAKLFAHLRPAGTLNKACSSR